MRSKLFGPSALKMGPILPNPYPMQTHETDQKAKVTSIHSPIHIFAVYIRGNSMCASTITDFSPPERVTAWFGSTISRAPFHAGGRTVERSAYRILFFIFLQQRPEHDEHARHEEQVTDYGHEHVRKVDAHGAQPTSNCSSNAPVKHFQARNHAG